MEVIKITPRGFCIGVVNAWKIVLQTRKEFPNSRIYMLGWFVHNKHMVEDILDQNIIVLDDKNTSRYDLVKNNPFQPGDILILSAHGTDEKTIQLAKEIGYHVVDTTCRYVTDTHNVIKEGLKNNKIIFYLGKTYHPESNASIALDKDRIKLITNLQDLEKLVPEYQDQEILVTNQTTLSKLDLQDYYDFITTHFHHYEIRNDLCDATQERQNALLNLSIKVDLLIVVGDPKSNNSNQLLRIGLRRKIPSYLINNLSELDTCWLKNVHKVAVTSGASTPTRITNEVIQYLENWKEE
ncbi:4-hydroxy-3-methylbut-2-enyl diphosphate reductase [Ureaplasma ceti]|uniref:4-hydroxy-3-methylbut-2-enyl diphosphate reductase n=1 Tax=Ureaplasma ceti TaxID=3119530 RepID=A0ABP9U964_9BACT